MNVDACPQSLLGCTVFENPHFSSDFDFRAMNTYSLLSFLRQNSNFIRFKVNFHGEILGFGAKIKIGEKVRISEHCGLLAFSSKLKNSLTEGVDQEKGTCH